MKKQTFKYMMLFVASLSMVTAHARWQPWFVNKSWREILPKVILGGFLGPIYLNICEEIVPKMMDRTPTRADYEREAIRLRDKILNKYKKGTLSSGVELANVDSIAIKVLDANTPLPKLPHFDASDEEWEEYYQKKELWLKWRHMQDGSVHGVTYFKRNLENKNPKIALNGEHFKWLGQEERDQITLHELAHALDECLRKSEEEKSDCYAWLHEDIRNNPNLKETKLSELHADKQSAFWMKKFWPDRAEALRKRYEKYEAYGADSVRSSAEVKGRAPVSQMAEWLSNKENSLADPLRNKEIKQLGLLWG